MKLLLALTLLASIQAFAPNAIAFSGRTAAFASVVPVEHEGAIEEAMRLSKEYGATSQEARVAWDIVEELNASDNSAATRGVLSEQDCLIGDDVLPTEDCNDYVAGIDAIVAAQDTLLDADQITSAAEKSLAESVKPVPLASSSTSAGDSAELTDNLQVALGIAKKITAELGITSSEAKLAWENVEEIASSGVSQATKKLLSLEECEIEVVDACEALEELNSALNLE